MHFTFSYTWLCMLDWAPSEPVLKTCRGYSLDQDLNPGLKQKPGAMVSLGVLKEANYNSKLWLDWDLNPVLDKACTLVSLNHWVKSMSETQVWSEVTAGTFHFLLYTGCMAQLLKERYFWNMIKFTQVTLQHFNFKQYKIILSFFKKYFWVEIM